MMLCEVSDSSGREILQSFLSRQRRISPGADLEAAHRVVLRRLPLARLLNDIVPGGTLKRCIFLFLIDY
ncbi:MAG: hypothetical protein NUV44_10170 [Candidatus Scalindua sp.]|nr:hypothetical protein [Candidatus Scalindua sp.]